MPSLLLLPDQEPPSKKTPEGDRTRLDNHQVFRITFLCSPREVIASGNHHLTIDNHDFIVRNRMPIIN
jgi:hypothetical protein